MERILGQVALVGIFPKTFFATRTNHVHVHLDNVLLLTLTVRGPSKALINEATSAQYGHF